MTKVRGCDIPDYLYYHVEHNVWLSFDKRLHTIPTEVIIGMTSYACSLSGEIIALTTKKVGKSLNKNQSCATVESGKWVGPVKVPLSGDILAVNQAAIDDPSLINNDPYGDGWIAKIQATDWATDVGDLLTGDTVLLALESKMDQDGFGGC